MASAHAVWQVDHLHASVTSSKRLGKGVGRRVAKRITVGEDEHVKRVILSLRPVDKSLRKPISCRGRPRLPSRPGIYATPSGVGEPVSLAQRLDCLPSIFFVQRSKPRGRRVRRVDHAGVDRFVQWLRKRVSEIPRKH